jgi:hypothetical protein
MSAPPPAAYVVRCARDPSTDGTGGDTVVDHIRLFPLQLWLRKAWYTGIAESRPRPKPAGGEF